MKGLRKFSTMANLFDRLKHGDILHRDKKIGRSSTHEIASVIRRSSWARMAYEIVSLVERKGYEAIEERLELSGADNLDVQSGITFNLPKLRRLSTNLYVSRFMLASYHVDGRHIPKRRETVLSVNELDILRLNILGTNKAFLEKLLWQPYQQKLNALSEDLSWREDVKSYSRHVIELHSRYLDDPVHYPFSQILEEDMGHVQDAKEILGRYLREIILA